MPRPELVRKLVELIDGKQAPHPLRVAIDGPDAAGKTMLADELACGLRATKRDVIRASIDGFHRPRAERYRRGPDSARGYYEDSFDLAALRTCLLGPLGPGGSRSYSRTVFDYRSDSPRLEAPSLAGERAVLLFDGVFLLRPELRDAWDVRIFVSARFEETIRRALRRDRALLGSAEEIERRYRTRYGPGQQLYFAAASPEEAADAVVVNDDLTRPSLVLGRFLAP